jgi:putative flippase GtrA
MSPEQISAVAGVVLALVFEYFPVLSTWYEQKDEGTKRQVMLGAMVLVVAVAYGLSCANFLSLWVCTVDGAWQAVLALISAVVANQGTHMLIKKPQKS